MCIRFLKRKNEEVLTGIKQFFNITDMNNSVNNKEGDLAVVYRNEVQNATVDSRFQNATFPDTVVLDNAITDNVEVRYRAVDSSVMFDCMGSLDSSRFRMDCYTDSGSIRIQYTSSDGITYTRTDTTGNPVDFGTEIYYEMADMWNDTIGKFIQIGGSTFGGLFEYSDNSWLLAPTQLTATQGDVYEREFYGKNGIERGKLQETVINDTAHLDALKNLWSSMSGGIHINLSSVASLFSGNEDIVYAPDLYLEGVEQGNSIYDGCDKLKVAHIYDNGSCKDFSACFSNNPSLVECSIEGGSGCTGYASLCQNSTALKDFPLLDTSSCTSLMLSAYGCSSLENFPYLDTSKVNSMHSMVVNCPNLSDESLNNLLLMCANSAVTEARRKYLRYDYANNFIGIGLSEEQATRCQSLSNYSAFTAAGWTTGY